MVRRSQGTLVFTRRVATTESLASVLRENGIKASALHSQHTRTERTRRLADLRHGRLKALVAPTVLDEGVDVPDVTLAIVMGGSKSRRQMIQRMGRVLRLKKDGGKAAFVVVYARETMEDLDRESGVEGCLDLIIATADSVERLEDNPSAATAIPPSPGTADSAVTASPSASEPPIADVAENLRLPTPPPLVANASNSTLPPGPSPSEYKPDNVFCHEPANTPSPADETVSELHREPVRGDDDLVGRLERLAGLWSRGLLSDQEFAAAKGQVLRT